MKYLLGEVTIGSLWTVRAPNEWRDAVSKRFFRLLEYGVRVRHPNDTAPHNVRFLHPNNQWKSGSNNRVNEESLVLELTWGKSFLFTGDIGLEAEEVLLELKEDNGYI